MQKLIVVKAAFDPEAAVWYVESSDVPGLAAEADSVEALVSKLPGMIADLFEEMDGSAGAEIDVPIELIAHASTRVRLAAAS